MKCVFKYEVMKCADHWRAFVELPADAQLLSVGLQEGTMVVWALVDPDYQPLDDQLPTQVRRLIVVNTGGEIFAIPEGARFLGTLTSDNGIVWHVWDGDAKATG